MYSIPDGFLLISETRFLPLRSCSMALMNSSSLAMDSAIDAVNCGEGDVENK